MSEPQQRAVRELGQIVLVLQTLENFQSESEIQSLRGVNNAYTFHKTESIDERLKDNVVIVKDRREREYAIIVLKEYLQTQGRGMRASQSEQDKNEKETGKVVLSYLKKCEEEGRYASVVLARDNHFQNISERPMYQNNWDLQSDLKKTGGDWHYIDDAMRACSIKVEDQEFLQVLNKEGKLEHHLMTTFIDEDGDELSNIKRASPINLASEKSPEAVYSPLSKDRGQILVDFENPGKKGLIVPLYREWGEELIKNIGPQYQVLREE